jgi:DNA-directed RNA polymerase specialized sigma24 family protein
MADAGDPSGKGKRKGDGEFPTTHWSIVLRARKCPEDTCAREAFGKLYLAYRHPLYCYALAKGYSHHEAEALTQDFLTHLLEKHCLARIDPFRGRFRNFLLTAMKRFMINMWRRVQSSKQGGGKPHGSLNASPSEPCHAPEPVDNASPDKLYDRNWACTLLGHVLARLRRDQEAAGKGALFDRLKPALMGERITPSCAAVAAEFHTTETALRMAVNRLRQRFRKLLRAEVAQTVSAPADIDDEIRYLFAALGGG